MKYFFIFFLLHSIYLTAAKQEERSLSPNSRTEYNSLREAARTEAFNLTNPAQAALNQDKQELERLLKESLDLDNSETNNIQNAKKIVIEISQLTSITPLIPQNETFKIVIATVSVTINPKIATLGLKIINYKRKPTAHEAIDRDEKLLNNYIKEFERNRRMLSFSKMLRSS